MQRVCWITVLCRRIHGPTLTQRVNCSKGDSEAIACSRETCSAFMFVRIEKWVVRWKTSRNKGSEYILGRGWFGVETGEEHMKESSGWGSMSLPKVRAVPACALCQKERYYTRWQCLTCCRITSSFNLFPSQWYSKRTCLTRKSP